MSNMKRNKITGIISLLMAGTIMLSGCGSAAGQETAGDSASSDSGIVAAQDNEDEYEERVALSIWAYGNSQTTSQYSSPADTVFWQNISEKFNVDFTFLDNSGGQEALSLLIGTDDLPDIIIDYDGTFPGGMQKMLNDGSIIALNDLMDAGYMPNLQAYLASDPAVDRVVKDDNGRYACAPMIRSADSPVVFSGNYVREDWLNDLGLEVPTTLDEMEKVLIAFRDEKGADCGYCMSNQRELTINAFGIKEGMYVDTTDNKIHYGVLEEEFLDALTTLNRWYEEGLIDPDAFTQDSNAVFAKIASGRTGLSWGWTAEAFNRVNTMKSETPEMEWKACPHPVAKEGDKFIVDLSSGYRVDSLGGCIAATCKYPERAARVLDYLYGEEGHEIANFGEEGITYEIVDGQHVYTDYVLNNPDGLTIEEALQIYAGNGNKPFVVDKEYQYGQHPLETQKYALSLWATPDGTIKNLPPESLSPEESSEYYSIMTDINTYKDEMVLKFILGTEPLENFPEFIDNLKKMNIERAIEIKQTEYDRFLAR